MLNKYKSIEMGLHFDMIKVLRVFLRKNDGIFEMILFAKTHFKMTVVLRLTRGLEIYCHIEEKIHHSFQNESAFNHPETSAKKSFQNERPLINLNLI